MEICSVEMSFISQWLFDSDFQFFKDRYAVLVGKKSGVSGGVDSKQSRKKLSNEYDDLLTSREIGGFIWGFSKMHQLPDVLLDYSCYSWLPVDLCPVVCKALQLQTVVHASQPPCVSLTDLINHTPSP